MPALDTCSLIRVERPAASTTGVNSEPDGADLDRLRGHVGARLDTVGDQATLQLWPNLLN